MKTLSFRLLALLALVGAPAAAQTYRLSDAERESVKNEAALGPERAPVLTPVPLTKTFAGAQSVLDRSLYPELTDGGEVRDRRMHGEVSVFAGSGGALGFAGTTAFPLGETGMASISVAMGRLPGFGFGSGFNQGFGDPLDIGRGPFGLGRSQGRFQGRPSF
ncbi:hypothetical protein [Sandarakinorhabdus sp.]|uniref:hypothetical protein n=1 Tax=Sandarakinorhabdus sp. TaxID=1916663 RepID=UPI00286E8FCF|nr:hypothetical protein [Sandarakinorhabdus sp.]